MEKSKRLLENYTTLDIFGRFSPGAVVESETKSTDALTSVALRILQRVKLK